MQTEFNGPKYRAACIEALQLPFPTLLFRLRWEAAKRLGLHRGRYEPSKLTPQNVLDAFPLPERTASALLGYFRSRGRVGFYFRRDDLPRIRRVWEKRLPHAREVLAARADEICRHEFAFLGSPLNRFGAVIDWHNEMTGRGRWPLRHWSTIDIRPPACLGDVKQTWELNRTQFFVTLARAYVLLQDEQYARELAAQLRSWINQNPSEMGVNWYSNLECAIRSASWLFAIELTLDSSAWDGELLTDVIRCLIDHHHHLFKDLAYSEYCMPGNHLLGDAMGIAMLSLYLPELPHSHAYLERACRILFREGPLQNLEDGTNFENAISYHRFVFYMYMLFARLLEVNQRRVPAVIWERLHRMCEFAVHMRAPSGRMCQIGDWDNGRTIVLDDSDVADFTSMLCTGAVRFQRGDFKAAAGEFREEALWLLGADSFDRFQELPSTRRIADKAFPLGGYYTWRSDWSERAEFALFKCGPFEAHTHADNLTLLYSAGGQDWLVDRGTYTYNGDWAWRTYFRGTRAHNGVVVDGFGQSLAHREFRWLGKPQQQVYHYHADPRFGYVCGSTSGFKHVGSPVKQARSVLLVRGEYILVVDALSANGMHDYELLWHLAPDLRVAAGLEGAVRANAPGGQALHIVAAGSSSLNLQIVKGQTEPLQGWHSRLYGEKEPASTVVYRTRTADPLLMVTLIALVKDKPEDGPRLAFDHAPGWAEALTVSVNGLGFCDRVSMPNPARLSVGAFPAELLWWARNGQRIRIGSSLSGGAFRSG